MRPVWNLMRGLVVPMVLSPAIGGCATAPRTMDTTHAAGLYALVSVDGKTLPATVSHGDTAIEVRSGHLSIGGDGTCVSRTVFVPPSGKEVVREVRANCVVDGATWTMRWKGAGTTVGTLEGSTFTMDNEGMAFVYRR